MSDYIARILIDESNDPVIEVLGIINSKSKYGDHIDKLTRAERIIFFVGAVEGEVNGGGFNQYLFNSSGKYAFEAIQALKLIRADYTASLLENAVNIYKNGPANDGRNEPEEDDLTEEQEAELNELDNKFYEYKDNLNALQLDFIKINRSEFLQEI